MLDKHDFEHLGEEIITSFYQFIKPHLEDNDLRRAYLEMNKWSRFKANMLKSVQAEYFNKKQYLDSFVVTFE